MVFPTSLLSNLNFYKTPRWSAAAAAALLFYKLSVDGTQQTTIVSAYSSGGRVILILKYRNKSNIYKF